MRRAGQELDPWQQDAITLMMAVREDGKWACFEYCEWCPRQNGKGGILEARALAGLFLVGEELIMWSAHEYKTAMEAFRRILWLLGNLGEKVSDNLYDVDGIPVKVNNTNGEEGLERLDTGARLKFIARSKGSGRGFSGDLNILDEAFALLLAQQAALMPTMSARPNPQLVYASSPPLSGDTGDVMYALRLRGDPTAPRPADAGPWQQDDSLGYRDWGLAGDLESLDEIDLDDEALWAATNPAMGIRISREHIARERRAMSPEDFARERLGVWPRRVTGGGGIISEEQWRELADPDAGRPSDVAFAIHVNLRRTHTAICYAGRRDDGAMQVGIVDWRPGTGWVVERVRDLRERWRPVAIAVDTRSESLLLELERAGITAPEDPERPQRGDLAVPSAAEAAAAFGLFVDACRTGRLRHLDEAPLNVALAGAGTRSLAGGATWDHRSPVEVAPLQAATLALWAYLTRAELLSDYDVLESVW